VEARYIVFTGILSGFSSFFGCLMLCYCSQAKAEAPPDWMLRTRSPVWAFDPSEPVRLVAYESDFRIRLGERFRVQIGLCNLSDQAIWIPRERFFSQHLRSPEGEFPSCVVEILNERGDAQGFVDASIAILEQRGPLTGRDFHVIEPGSCVTLSHPMQNWRPKAPGTYTVRITLDTRGPIPEAWDGLLDRVDPSAFLSLEAMPQRLYVSNPLKIVVER